MNFEIKTATRGGVKPLVGFYGPSGTGKTMSALLFARGLVGPSGRVILIDSEAGRGSLFADIIPSGYSVIDIEPPFSPQRYQEAIEVAENKADCIVIDSMSHEHNGDGGVLDMQEAELDRMAGKDNWGKREACKMASWIAPKTAHKKMVQRLLRSKVALICCLRGELKTHMLKGSDGKNKVITDEFSSPLFDPRFIYELLLNFETIAREGQGGFVIPRKITHPSIATLLPAASEQIGVKHGAALAAWCQAAALPVGASHGKPPQGTPDPLKDAKAALWAACKPFRGESKSWDCAVAKLCEWKILSDHKTVNDLTLEEFREVSEKLSIQLNP